MLKPILFVIALFAAGGGVAFAHGDGGDMPRPFMQRHAVMGSLAAHMKAAKAAMDAGDLKAVANQAEAIHWLARILPDVFPKGSGPEMGDTRAAPKIWEDRDGFVAASHRLADTASALAKDAKSGNADATEAAFRQTGKEGCGGCHKTYRLPR